MADKTSEPSAFAMLISVGCILAVGYFGYTMMFPSDRAQVRSCISAIMEASRGEVGYGDFRQAIADLDQAGEVAILDVSRRPFGAEYIVTITYSLDGNRNNIMCAQ